jgi:hypothetical protein
MKLRDGGFYSGEIDGAYSSQFAAAPAPNLSPARALTYDLQTSALKFIHHKRLTMQRSPVRRRAGSWQTDRLLSSCIISGL